MRIISCASYYGTGSSAITDLVSEYEDVLSLTNYEFRFVQDPDGISDLEYNLVENHNRHNSGHALKRYKKLVDFYAGNKFIKKYEPFFKGNWKNLSYEYIASLTNIKYKGWWQYDLYDRGKFFYYRKILINKLLKETLWKNNEKVLNVLPHEITYCSAPTQQEFLCKTKKYINRLFESANIENKSNIMVDQIVPPSNLKRYIRYFDNILIFVIERDPRDLYILEHKFWKTNVIPTENAEIFCQWYLYTRNHRLLEEFPENVKFLYFEDLVYKYEKTKSEIQNFLKFTSHQHINKFKFFDPQISIKNTRLWESNSEFKKEIEFIENKLSDYLYDYSFFNKEGNC